MDAKPPVLTRKEGWTGEMTGHSGVEIPTGRGWMWVLPDQGVSFCRLVVVTCSLNRDQPDSEPQVELERDSAGLMIPPCDASNMTPSLPLSPPSSVISPSVPPPELAWNWQASGGIAPLLIGKQFKIGEVPGSPPGIKLAM